MFKFLFSFLIGICLLCNSCSVQTLSDEQLYADAVRNTHLFSKSNIHDLVTLNKDDNLVTYIGDLVLMATFHNVPRFYPIDHDIELSIDGLWLVSYKELEAKLSNPVNCSNKRIIQILGERIDSNYSHLSLVLVDPHKLLRPAYVQDPFINKMSLSLTTSDKNFESWFYQMKAGKDYPWTALGYTYDWGNSRDVYGLSEFILRKGSTYHAVDTITIDKFISSGCKVKY